MQITEHKIKAILFDLGETIICFGKVNKGHLFRQSVKLTYDFLIACGQPAGNFSYYCWRNLFWLRFHYLISNITGNDFDSLHLLKKIGSKTGIKLDDQQWHELIWLWYQPLRHLAANEPDIIQTLTALEQSGLKMGIISNTFINASSLDRHLKQLGILDFFPIRLYSYQFDFRKPNPRIFKIGSETIAHQPQNIMFVGDRLDNDIKPALKLGMTAVCKSAYTNAGKKIPPNAYKIDQLSELPSLIKKINSTEKCADKPIAACRKR